MCVCLIEKPIFTSFSRLPHPIWDDVIVIKRNLQYKRVELTSSRIWGNQNLPEKIEGKEIKRKRVNYTLIDFRKQLKRRCFL